MSFMIHQGSTSVTWLSSGLCEIHVICPHHRHDFNSSWQVVKKHPHWQELVFVFLFFPSAFLKKNENKKQGKR